ncbi:transcriptional regulator [Planotetraspora thailandica]|uniref:Transcriptional regulator n=1 Tax=Planotetraspora thailandica TaxID=487172 RepID=A0A8J3Y0V9_9ACTN|nr:MarR family transcriptional regulator [Planotetraspora thailandica]GII58705.1 transcriptional regulator [Planotetraspora thailandica]
MDIDDQDPGMRLVHLLRTLTVEFDLVGADFAATHLLHPTDLRALIHLLDAARAGISATPGWLGEQMGLQSASTTGLVDRLEKAGHIRRVRDTQDRRRVLLVVGDQAVALGWAFFGPLITELVTAMRSFSEEELATVHRFLATMTEVVLAARRAGTP